MEDDQLSERFEQSRPLLRAVAYRMLGSLSEADDAVQETWLRMNRYGADGVTNFGAWLRTVLSRVCLDVLRTRAARREEPLGVVVPDPVVGLPVPADPEQEALLADSVGLALMVVLQTLAPAERLAFVLHDMFAVPFEEIAAIVERSPAAARQLASRARRRVKQGAPVSDADLAGQHAVVEAFLAASREGDFEALVAILDPDVVLRADYGTVPGAVSTLVRGARQVAGQALTFARLSRSARPAMVNGTVGVVSIVRGQPISVVGVTVVGGRIATLDILADPRRVRRLVPGIPPAHETGV